MRMKKIMIVFTHELRGGMQTSYEFTDMSVEF